MAKAGTLSDIARRCSVSQSTVSRVLNNSKKGRFSVSEGVRQRILHVANELNYRPSVAARNLAASKTRLVAVLGLEGIWSDRVGPAEEAMVTLAAALDRAGYELCLQFWSERHGKFDPPPLRVDGVIATAASFPDDLKALEEADLPYVSVNGAAGPRGCHVAPDDRQGTFLALQHLTDLGHKRIAYLDHVAIDATHPSVFERREAFAAAAEQLGFTSPEIGLPRLGHNQPWDSYYEPFVRKAVVEGGATAVLAYSHQGALALLRTAYELGLSVPRDFSVACFNDAPVLRLSVPAVTAVDVPAAPMGEAAAALLLKRMQSEEPLEPERVRIPESLIVRESTAPPPASRRAG